MQGHFSLTLRQSATIHERSGMIFGSLHHETLTFTRSMQRSRTSDRSVTLVVRRYNFGKERRKKKPFAGKEDTLYMYLLYVK